MIYICQLSDFCQSYLLILIDRKYIDSLKNIAKNSFYTVSLESCINYSIENNLQIKQSIVDASISKANLISAQNAYLPTVNAIAEEARTNGRLLNLNNSTSSNNYYSTSGSINGTIDLFDGFQKQNNVKIANLNLQATLMDT